MIKLSTLVVDSYLVCLLQSRLGGSWRDAWLWLLAIEDIYDYDGLCPESGAFLRNSGVDN